MIFLNYLFLLLLIVNKYIESHNGNMLFVLYHLLKIKVLLSISGKNGNPSEALKTAKLQTRFDLVCKLGIKEGATSLTSSCLRPK
jgi:hypothetical protein